MLEEAIYDGTKHLMFIVFRIPQDEVHLDILVIAVEPPYC
jgi:hypothetical protein